MTAMQPGWYPDPIDRTVQRWWDGKAWTSHVARDGVTWTLPLPAVPSTTKTSTRRVPIWVWILIGIIAIVPLLVLSPLVAPLALALLLTGIVALTKGTPTWLRLKSRKAAATITAVAAVAFIVTGSVSVAAIPNAASRTPADAVRFADAGVQPADAAPSATPSSKPKKTAAPVTTVVDEVVTEAVPYAAATIEDGAMPAGQSQVTTVGQPGERTLTYRVTLVDGKETSRELVTDVITVAPVTETTSVGTYVEPPPPPAAPSGCDSNYAEACVPISSDVDCAGGSGNGPAYFDGIAKVVGSDIYELDRDGDGYACEPN
jgi:resuscitation-promoting factor RpfB